MKNACLIAIALVLAGLSAGCAATSSHRNVPVEPDIVKQPQKQQKCVLVSRFGAMTIPDKELVPYMLQVLPEVLQQQEGFAEVRLESDGKSDSGLPCILIKGVVEKAASSAVPAPMMTTINFKHSSQVRFTVYDVSHVQPSKRFDEALQSSVYTFDVTAAQKLYSSHAMIDLRANYGAQADIPKFVAEVLEVAAKQLSDQIANQVYLNTKAR